MKLRPWKSTARRSLAEEVRDLKADARDFSDEMYKELDRHDDMFAALTRTVAQQAERIAALEQRLTEATRVPCPS